MTTNAARAEVLARALRASVEGDQRAIADLYTEDVKAWTPTRSVASAAELAEEFALRDEAFSDVELEVVPLDVGGDYAVAEWRVSMTHTGQLALGDEMLDPTGLRITLNGATVAEFRDDRICSLRQYWDELAALEQLGVIARDDFR
jgi:ketosteroid isomerase-like protein